MSFAYVVEKSMERGFVASVEAVLGRKGGGVV